MTRAEKTKFYQAKLKQLKAELESSIQIVRDMQRRQAQLKGDILNIENTLSQLIPQEIQISDHAIVRFLERHCNVDIDAVKEEIKTFVGNENYGQSLINGFVIKNGNVVTFKGME